MKKNNTFKKHLSSKCIIFLIMIILIIPSNMVVTQASIASEAVPYTFGETITGTLYPSRYIQIKLNKKQRLNFNIRIMGYKAYLGDAYLYTPSGKNIFTFSFKYNSISEINRSKQSKILTKGTYYLELHCKDGTDYKLTVTTEDVISLNRGSITTVKGQKKKINLKMKSIKNAEGYTIKYSTDRSFKRGVKTKIVYGNKATLKKLKRKTRYFVKTAPFASYEDGTLVNGKYSQVKSVLTK